MQYRADFVVRRRPQSLVDGVDAGAAAGRLRRAAPPSPAGRFPEALLVVAWFTLLRGVLEGASTRRSSQVVEHVRNGTLDFVLLKPADAQFLVSTASSSPGRSSTSSPAVAIVVVRLRRARPRARGRRRRSSPASSSSRRWSSSTRSGSSSSARRSGWCKLDNLSYLFGSIFDAARWPHRPLPRRLARALHLRHPARADDDLPGDGAARLPVRPDRRRGAFRRGSLRRHCARHLEARTVAVHFGLQLMKPPASRTVDQVDVLHGQEVRDPYRWLEDPNDPEVRAWVDEQNRVTAAFLAGPTRDGLIARLREVWNYERYGVPTMEGGRAFYFKNDGLQNQAVLWTAPQLGEAGRVLLDPNQLSADGTVALTGMAVTRDGRRLAYGLSALGLRLARLARARRRDRRRPRRPPSLGAVLGRVVHARWHGLLLQPLRRAAAGAGAHRGRARPEALLPQASARRSRRTVSSTSAPTSRSGASAPASPTTAATSSSRSGTAPIRRTASSTRTSRPTGRSSSSSPTPTRPTASSATTGRASGSRPTSRRRAAASSRSTSRARARDAWRELIPETEHALQGVSVVGERFFAHYLARRPLARLPPRARRAARAGEVALPGLGSAGGFGGRREDTETFYSFSSFTMPTRSTATTSRPARRQLVFAPKVEFDPDAFETRQVFYHQQGRHARADVPDRAQAASPRDGRTRRYLYGYGGFNISITPQLRSEPARLAGAGRRCCAIAEPARRRRVRRGVAPGRARSGASRTSSTTSSPRPSGSIAEGYTSPSKLAIAGGSNGGLLVGACLTQRPELFGAALPDVGVMDMLRFHKFTIGWAWISDYGSPDDADEFPVLRGYSPLHNLQARRNVPGDADHDRRHRRSRRARRTATSSPRRCRRRRAAHAPILIRVESAPGTAPASPSPR